MTNKRNEKIILIEDDQKMLSLLTTLIGMEGFQAIPMRSPTPETIVETVRQERPSAAVLDVHLADKNGIELLKSVQPVMAEFKIRVLMTSGEDLHIECLNAGADGFLLKPYMPGELLAWLNENSKSIPNKES